MFPEEKTARLRRKKVFRRLFTRRPTSAVHFVVHNRNHVRIFVEANHELQLDGIRTRFCVPLVFAQSPMAVAELKARGIPWVTLDDLVASAVPGDVIVMGLDNTSKKLVTAIAGFHEREIRTVGVVEGARFGKATVFRNVQFVLVWGRSGHQVFRSRAIITGSPIIEAMACRADPPEGRNGAVINYKFTWGDAGRDQDQHWLKDALAACKSVQLDPIISRHPAMTDPIPGVDWSDRDIENLIQENPVLITRSSSTIYQALMAGARPFLFAIENEALVEFADPLGAFPIAYSVDQLRMQLAEWKSRKATYDSRNFLENHVSVDPNRPSPIRIAEALKRVMRS